MKKVILAITLMLVAAVANAQPTALQLLQQQLASSPVAQQATQQATQGAQQALVQQAIQQLAANPQLLTSMMNSLSPQQQTSLMQQALVAGQKIFTPAEQTKLTQFITTPEGASIAQKMPGLIQQLTPVVLQMYAAKGATIAPAAGATQHSTPNTQH